MSDTQKTKPSTNEEHLANVLHTLRKVTSGSTNDNQGRITLYLESIEVEIERITGTR